MNELFNLINNANVPWFLAAGIIFLALTIWLIFLQQIRSFKLVLNNAQRYLKHYGKISSKEQFEELNQFFKQQALFAQHWEAFSQSLIVTQPSTGIYYTQRPAYYFNLHTFVAPKMNLALFQAVPNSLVGIGLFFTFMGLVAALWFASEGVAAADMEQAKQALRDLLHAATFKFVTSIAGLLASLVFSWREKAHLYQLQTELNYFCALLESRLLFSSLEQLTVQQTQILQAQQIAQAQQEAAFSRALQTAIEPLTQAMTGLVAKVGSINQQALETMMLQFSQQLQGAAGTELRELTHSLQTLVPTISQMQQGLMQSSQHFNQNMVLASQTLQESVKQASEHFLTQITETHTQLQQQSQQKFTEVSSNLEQINVHLQDLQHSLLDVSQQLNSQLRSAATYSAQCLTEAGTLVNQQLSASGSALANALQSGATHFIQAQQQLTQTFEHSSQTFQVITTQLNGLQARLQQTGELLMTTHAPLQQVAHHLTEAIAQVHDLVAAVNGMSRMLIETSQETTINFSESTQAVTQTWQKYQGHFERVDEDVAKIFVELSNGLEAYRQQVEHFTGRLEESLTVSVKALSSLIAELVEAIEDLHAARHPIK